jgi:hypothetical protein
MADIISRPTRRAFQESYVSYCVLREIETDFDDVGICRSELPPNKPISGARRSLVEEYYKSIDWTSPTDVRRILDVYESHLLRLTSRGINDELAKLIKLLERDHIKYEDGKIIFSAPTEALDDIVDANLTIDVSQLHVNISRIKNAINADPSLAIGSSKELVEATCKAILVDRKVLFSATADLPELVHLVSEQLQLVAANVTDAAKGAKSIRKVLGSLTNIVYGISELRNLYGSGHGRPPMQKGLGPRHARLCAGVASALSLFLMETAKEKK